MPPANCSSITSCGVQPSMPSARTPQNTAAHFQPDSRLEAARVTAVSLRFKAIPPTSCCVHRQPCPSTRYTRKAAVSYRNLPCFCCCLTSRGKAAIRSCRGIYCRGSSLVADCRACSAYWDYLAENRVRALRRLRERIALELRASFDLHHRHRTEAQRILLMRAVDNAITMV
jgi:hypothetical protein